MGLTLVPVIAVPLGCGCPSLGPPGRMETNVAALATWYLRDLG